MANSTQTDPFEQQHRQYDAQYEAIGTMYDPEDGETDWTSLAVLVEEAFNDPALPRLHRAEFHIINAWCSNEPELQLGFALEMIDDMVQVLQANGRSQEEIDARLVALREMFDLTEGAVKRTRKRSGTKTSSKGRHLRTKDGKKKKLRRVDSGVANDPMDSADIPPFDGPGSEDPVSAVWQEFDKSTRSWAALGAAVDPAGEDDETLLGYVGDECDAPPVAEAVAEVDKDKDEEEEALGDDE